MDCFASKRIYHSYDQCIALNMRSCDGDKCPFYKSREQHEADRLAAWDMLQALPEPRRSELLKRYHQAQ